ncbi:MAG TPA: hypothetical protein VLM40_03925 [Gemmata sp.]|nr:hypothetical protein [Gemmata sp.]
MKLFSVRTAAVAICTVALALVPARQAPAESQPQKSSDAPARAKEKIMVWVEKFLSSTDCALETELTVNGKSVGKFQSTTQKDISELIKSGRNTISFTTTPQEPASSKNELKFRIGAVTTNPKTKKTTMSPILMIVQNDVDWSLNDDTGKYTHPFGPNPKTPSKKSVTLTYNFYYAGIEADRAQVKEGDYVLQGEAFFARNPSVVATVTVNGKSLGSFHAGLRSLVITDLLKPGENEIRLATEAVANQLTDNDTSFDILGPMAYSTTKQKFLGKQVVQFKAMEGWTRDRTSGVLHVKGKPDTFTHERTIRFTLEAK